MIIKVLHFFNQKRIFIGNLVLFFIILSSFSAVNVNSFEFTKNNQLLVFNQNSNFSLNGWNNFKEIQISPKTPVNNYQVKIELNSSNFNYYDAKIDGSDLRFTDLNNNSLNYWIEQWQNGGNSIIWVKVLNAGTTSIVMYYGNSSARSQSNGDNTFLFFDNFSRNFLDLSKWQIDSDEYSSITLNNNTVSLISTAPDPHYQYLALGFDNLTLEHGQTYGNTIDTSVMLRDNQLVIHDSVFSTGSNLALLDHNWITGEILWINSSLLQFENMNNNNISQLTTTMPRGELPISLSASGIINGIGTWYGIVLKSYFLAGEGTAVGFSCYQNTTYDSNEYPNLIVNWIYVRVLGNNAVYQVINYQQTNQNLSDSNNFSTLVIFGSLGIIGIICCIVIIRAKTYRNAVNKYEIHTPWNQQDRIQQFVSTRLLCINCNEKLNENDQLCGNCGARVFQYKQDKV